MSDAFAGKFLIRQEQDFAVYVLQNIHLELAVVPELGAKVISLVNRQTGREWMWHPPGGMKLFGNHPGEDFAGSTMTGWDECLPTIKPCMYKGRSLPDHGEVWSVPWHCDSEAWLGGVLKTSVRLSTSPFLFERAIELRGNVIHLDYHLTNLGGEPEDFLWAMHPLVPIYEGDELELSDEAWKHLAGERWARSLEFPVHECAFSKVFAGPLREGRAAIANARTGDRMIFGWDTTVNDTLGVWLTRGGWNGHHHLALEPTNGASDSLSQALMEGKRCGTISPNASLSWQVRIQIDPAS